MNKFPQLISALVLGGFAMLGTTLVAVIHDSTTERIAENQRQVLLRQLHQLIPSHSLDNDLLSDVINVSVPEILNSSITSVYRARKGGQPVAAFLSPVIARGYAGPIHLIVAIRHDGTLAGVRVLHHKETPGLGDRVEIERSDWILSFTNRSLGNPEPEGWKVKRDGGVFDQFTGATITPRGVINAIHATLKYFDANREMLFMSKAEEKMGS